MLKRIGVVLTSCVGIWNATGCVPATQPTHATHPKPMKAASTMHPAYPPDTKDEPRFVQHAGKAPAIDLAPTEATVTGRLQTPHATYLLLHASHDGVLSEGVAVLDSVIDGNGNPLVAAVAGRDSVTQSLSAPVYDLVLRLGGQTALAKLTEVQWFSRGNWRSNVWTGGYRQILTVVGAESAPLRKELETEFAKSMAHWFQLTAHQEPFAAFAAARTLRKLAKSSDALSPSVGQPARGRIELLDLMEFYTGRSAVNDSLQFRRGLQSGNSPPQRNTESLEALQPSVGNQEDTRLPAPVTSGQACAGCSAISAYVPADALVLEFATLKDMVHLPRLLDRKLGPLLRVAEATGGSSHLIERYRRQLALELDGFAETAGQFAVKSAAVVLSDPYLREGTDLTLIFQAENAPLLQGVLENHLQRARREHPDLRTTQEQIEGQNVALHSTPDGRIRRFEHGFDDYRVLSNSRSAMARMLRVRQGSLARLSQELDYAAARARRPSGGSKERAWLYFGNGFVENLVGPRSKILESRRMRAKSELMAVDHAALLFGWMERRRPTSLAELLQSGWLERSDLTHFDGAPITWSPATGAHSKWGFAQSLQPIGDLQISKVNREEATAYRAFRRRYEATMNGMLDPTMLRFERTADDEDLRTELSVFPIAVGGRFNSEFRHVAELVGDGRIDPGHPSSGLSASIAVGDGSPLRELFESSVGDLFAKREITASFVGDWAKIGLDEGSAVWDLAGDKHLLPTVGGNEQAATGALDKLIPRLPVWVAVHIRSRILLTAALAAVRAKLASTIPNDVKWYEDQTYHGIRLTRVHIQEGGSANAAQANAYYAVAGDVLLLSLRRDVLRSRIDEVLAGRTPRGVPVSSDPAQLALDWAPKLRGWLHNTAAGMLDRAAIDAHERACVGLRVLALGHDAPSEAPELRRSSALRLLGYEPEALQGGELRWQNGQCAGGSYGAIVEPVAPDAQNPSLQLHQVLSSISLLRATLGIAPYRDALELRARLQLSNGPTHSKP